MGSHNNRFISMKFYNIEEIFETNLNLITVPKPLPNDDLSFF
jgi:hypothetical protein